MKAYLVGFIYEHWCQGYEKTSGTLLVYAHSFGEAVQKIKECESYHAPYSFKDLTLE